MRRRISGWVLLNFIVGVVGCGSRDGLTMPGSAYDAAATSVAPDMPADDQVAHNTEAYDHIVENPFLLAKDNPLSTFSIDVDTASYSNVRRLLRERRQPPRGAVRLEELVNYFSYDYMPPTDDRPFSVHIEAAECPWHEQHQLVRIGLKGREIDVSQRPLSNLVLLLDVSGSMESVNKLPLVKESMRLLLEQMTENDRVAIVVYAGASGLVLPSTTADRKEVIMTALDRLAAGGSTNGGEGLRLAYAEARSAFIRGGVNRVILCTDGDFNVGTTDQSGLVSLIEEEAASGVSLSVLGFGIGNYKDSTMEKLADHGDGNYAYIDTRNEAYKVFVEQLTGTLITIAKDVKIQVDFNPAQVGAYRLLGYENRMLRAEDFADDAKDAGEIGAGHTVTAFYEIIPAGAELPPSTVEPSKYQEPGELTSQSAGNEMLTVRLRYKLPDGEKSIAMDVPFENQTTEFAEASQDFRFAASVAEFGLLLRDSEFRGSASLQDVLQTATASIGDDPHGYRREFLELVKLAVGLP